MKTDRMKYKKVIFSLVMAASVSGVFAQSGTNSPYSQYGFGVLNDHATGFNKGMDGLGQAIRKGNQVVPQNPASFSAVDSLSLIFDVGMSGQITNFSENGVKKNAKNANFEYAVAAFRAFRHLGVSFGILPFSNIGYNYSSSGSLNQGKDVNYVNTYSGSGGLRQVYLGAGWEPVRNLSVGASFSYLWGELNRVVANNYTDGAGSVLSTINTLTKSYTAEVNNYKLDFGVQYSQALNKNDKVVVGATFSPKHNLKSTPECMVLSTNTSTGVSNSTSYSVPDGLELPNMFGAGVTWYHSNRFLVGADYSLQQWGKTAFPVYDVKNEVPSYELDNSYFKDRQRVTFGGEYCQNAMSRHFMSRIRYRLGTSYTTPYYNINGKTGPKELSVSAGFGIPIINAFNNRSLLNVSAQWAHLSGDGLLTENTFRINIGITFNERWFMKWKVE